jgi:hypothetical protein
MSDISSTSPSIDDLLEGAKDLAEALDHQQPQVKERGEGQQLNYLIRGSLIFPLYTQADTFSDVTNQDRGIKRSRPATIPDESQEAFKQLTRQIGDIDYIPIQDNFHLNDISRSDLPDGAHDLFEDDLDEITYDPLDTTTKKAAQLTIDDNELYVSHPEELVASKTIQLLEEYEKKQERIDHDFPLLLDAVEPLVGREQLVEATYDSLLASEEAHKERGKKKIQEARRKTSLPNQPYGPDHVEDKKKKWQSRFEGAMETVQGYNLPDKAADFLSDVYNYDQEHGEQLFDPDLDL